MNRSAINAAGYLLPVVLVVAAVGCASMGSMGSMGSTVGSTSKQVDGITLQAGGPHSTRWESKDVVLNFTYTLQSDSIQLEGKAELTPRLTKAFFLVKKLAILANLMDQDRVILASKSIVLVGKGPIDTWRYKKSIDAPPGTVRLNFSYNGTAFDVSTDQIDMKFWRVP